MTPAKRCRLSHPRTPRLWSRWSSFPSRWKQEGISERCSLGVGWAHRPVLIRAPMIRTRVKLPCCCKIPFYSTIRRHLMLVCLITSRAIKHQPALPSPSFWNVPLFFFTPRRSTRFCSLIGRPSARRVNNAVTAGELTPVDRNNWRNLNSIPSRFNFPTIRLPFQNLPS